MGAFGPKTPHYLADKVECNGTENSLRECTHRGLGVHFSCLPGEHAGVVCDTNQGTYVL